MCGIGGIVSFARPAKSQAKRLAAVRRALAHRGPDDQNNAFVGDAALTATRLSLLDRSGGQQPMTSGDGRFTLVYNGEVYNHQSLQRRLADRWKFRTRSDTEVVLAAYVRWGPQCLEELQGMFAFFVWDRHDRVGFAARDRLGVKPLAYRHEPGDGDRGGGGGGSGEFLFASEAKAILAAMPGAPRANTSAILEYLVAPCFSGVESTMFEGVEYLPPGHFLTFDRRQGLQLTRWWDFELATNCEDEQAAALALRQHLTEAVADSLQADEEIGIFLSGGLDSSLLAALAAAQGQPLKAFTVRFQDQHSFDYRRSRIVLSDDAPYARDAGRQLATRHIWVDVDRDQLAADVEQLAIWNDALPAWEQELAQFHLARAASQQLKAVLVGDAADETHFGYPFLLDEVALRSPAEIIRRFAEPPIRRDLLPDPVAHHARRYRELAERAGHSWNSRLDRLRATTYLIVKRWLPRLLHNGDIHTMAWGLEARVPFADSRLVELAARVHPDLGLRHGTEKWLLRRATAGLLPNNLRWRRKSALPKDQGAAATYAAEATQALRRHGDFLGSFLELNSLRQMLAQPSYDEVDCALLFRITALAHWHRHYEVRTSI